MKKPHDSFEAFPQDQVRAAISKGIVKGKQHGTIPRLGRSRKKRKLIYVLSSVAAVFLILVGTSHYSPVLASSLSQIPIIGSVFGNSDLIGLQKAQENKLTNEIGETQTVNGISVTLDEILYDQNNITIGLFIESEEQLSEQYFGAGMDFTINGEVVGSSGSYGETILSTTTRTAIEEINVNEDIPEKFDLGLVLYGTNDETWYFSTAVEKIADLDSIPVHHTQTVDGLQITITEMTIGKTATSMTYESFEEETDFNLSRGGNIEFLVVDQDGNEITGQTGGVTGELVKDSIIHKSNKQFDPLEGSVTELTVTPYFVAPTDWKGVEIDEDGNETELELEVGSMSPVEFESFKVEIP